MCGARGGGRHRNPAALIKTTLSLAEDTLGSAAESRAPGVPGWVKVFPGLSPGVSRSARCPRVGEGVPRAVARGQPKRQVSQGG
jgi:hypothetical protein